MQNAGSTLTIEDRYRPLLELGRGGTARVYLAMSLTAGLRKLVVLKTLAPELRLKAEMRTLFLQEAELCARLNHPNIVQVHEVVDHDKSPVIVMEYLEGLSLSQALARSRGRLPTRLRVHAIAQILAGLHYFHELRDYDHVTELKPVHRDVSPQNAFLTYEGAVKLLDFGIARHSDEKGSTLPGVVKGKLHYMSPEQLLGGGYLDRRSDIFSAGVMLWEALAGCRMWHGRVEQTVVRSLMTGTLPSLRESGQKYADCVYRVVQRATAQTPEERYATALEFQIDVEKILDSLGGQVHARELSEYMQTEFAAGRSEEAKSIDAAIRNPLLWSSVGRPPNSTFGPVMRRPSSAPASILAANTGGASPKRRQRVRWILGALVGFLAAIAVVRFVKVMQNPATSNAAAVPIPQPSSIHVSVLTTPVNADILLDGEMLGRSPLVSLRAREPRDATLEIRAERYVTLSRTIRLNEDLNLNVVLVDSPTSDVTPTPSVVEPRPRRKRARPLATSSPNNAAPRKPHRNSVNCSPPYRLAPDGVRVYKVECF